MKHAHLTCAHVKAERLRGAVLLGCVLGLSAISSAAAQDKSEYHLFHPVPAEQMREMSTDRPDTTESAITVDAGHFQVEADLVVLMLDKEGSVKTTGYELLPINLKAGLLNWMDLQLVLEPYHRVVSKAAGVRVVDDGYGATTVRLKMNVWGNDEGSTAFALMPFVTYVDDGVDFGLIAPLGIALPAGFDSTVMLEADVVRREDNGERGLDMVATGTVSHDIVGPLGGYFELVGAFPTYDTSLSTLAVDGGLTLGLGDDVQLDAGTRIGAAGPIADIELFVGASARI
jgi:hypothetical protein